MDLITQQSCKKYCQRKLKMSGAGQLRTELSAAGFDM